MFTNAKLILMYNELCAVIYIPLRFQKKMRERVVTEIFAIII
jgi:hypothetical protein